MLVDGGSIGIMSKPGYNVTFANACMKITTKHTGSNAIPIHVTDGTLVIDGGAVAATNPNNVAIAVLNSGDIYLNSNITVNHKLTATGKASSIYAPGGTIYVNGGSIYGQSSNAPILNAKKIVINAGKLNLTSGFNAIYATNEGDVQINGGTVEIMANHAFNKAPALGEKVTGFAGPNAKDAKPYDGKNYGSPWLMLSDQPITLPTEESTAPGILPTYEPTAPTQATTEPSQVPSAAPTGATTVPTESKDNQALQDETDTGSDSAIFLVIAIVLVVVLCSGITVFLIKRKKS